MAIYALGDATPDATITLPLLLILFTLNPLAMVTFEAVSSPKDDKGKERENRPSVEPLRTVPLATIPLATISPLLVQVPVSVSPAFVAYKEGAIVANSAVELST